MLRLPSQTFRLGQRAAFFTASASFLVSPSASSSSPFLSSPPLSSSHPSSLFRTSSFGTWASKTRAGNAVHPVRWENKKAADAKESEKKDSDKDKEVEPWEDDVGRYARPRSVVVGKPKRHKPAPAPIITQSRLASTQAVFSAIVSNLLVAACKIGSFVVTGSGSMLSEGIHSLADTANQLLLYVGIRRSQKGPTAEHPYGHGPEQHVWALISAVGIFFLGSGCTIYHGISTLIHPQPLTHLSTAMAVLGFSALLEGLSLAIAARACVRGARDYGMTFKDYVIKGPDPMAVAVLMEDSAAVIGLGIAAACVGMTSVTGNPVWDSVGSMAIGTLLGCVATFLVQKNKDALVGRAIPADQRKRILAVIQNDSVVRTIHNVKAVSLGSQQLRFQAELDFNGDEIARRYIQQHKLDLAKLCKELDTKEKMEAFLIKYGDGVIDTLATEVDRLEEEIKRKVPEAKYLDIEAH